MQISQTTEYAIYDGSGVIDRTSAFMSHILSDSFPAYEVENNVNEFSPFENDITAINIPGDVRMVEFFSNLNFKDTPLYVKLSAMQFGIVYQFEETIFPIRVFHTVCLRIIAFPYRKCDNVTAYLLFLRKREHMLILIEMC